MPPWPRISWRTAAGTSSVDLVRLLSRPVPVEQQRSRALALGADLQRDTGEPSDGDGAGREGGTVAVHGRNDGISRRRRAATAARALRAAGTGDDRTADAAAKATRPVGAPPAPAFAPPVPADMPPKPPLEAPPAPAFAPPVPANMPPEPPPAPAPPPVEPRPSQPAAQTIARMNRLRRGFVMADLLGAMDTAAPCPRKGALHFSQLAVAKKIGRVRKAMRGSGAGSTAEVE